MNHLLNNTSRTPATRTHNPAAHSLRGITFLTLPSPYHHLLSSLLSWGVTLCSSSLIFNFPQYSGCKLGEGKKKSHSVWIYCIQTQQPLFLFPVPKSLSVYLLPAHIGAGVTSTLHPVACAVGNCAFLS